MENDITGPRIYSQAQSSRRTKKKAEVGQLSSDDVLLIDPGIIPTASRKEAVFIYFDETDIHWCPDKGKGYQQIGRQQLIQTPGIDDVRYLLGGVIYPSGEGLYHIYERKRTMEVENWLASVCERYPSTFIFLVWDNAKTHTTDMLLPFLEAHRDQICTVFLPTYSPWLNLISRLWRQMRTDITRNSFFSSIQATCQAVVDWFSQLPFSRFMSLVGIDIDQLILIEANMSV